MTASTPDLKELAWLAEHDRITLSAMALLGDPLSARQVAAVCARLGVYFPNPRSKGSPLSPSASVLDLRLRAWDAQGWLHLATDDDLWWVTPDAQHALLTQAGRNGELTRLAKVLGPDEDGLDHEILSARCALYSGDHETVQDLLGESMSSPEDVEDLFELLPPNRPAAAVELLPAPWRATYLSESLALSLEQTLAPRADHIALLGRLEPSPITSTARARAHMLYTLLSLERPGELALDPNHAATQEALALQHLVNGSFEAARAAASLAWSYSNSDNKRRKKRLQSPLAPLLTMVLATGTPQDKAIATEQLKLSDKRSNPERLAYSAIQALLGPPSAMPFGIIQWSWQSFLVAVSIAGWLKRSLSIGGIEADWAREYAAYYRSIHASWLAEQFEGATAGMNPEARSATPKAGALAALVKPREAWEQALDELEAELGEPGVTPEPSQDRLVWQIHLLGGHLELRPRCQKRSKSGWTKGRPVALQRLVGQDRNASWVTAADQQILAHIEIERDWYGSTTYLFDETVALSLIGHPLVFWKSDPDTPVEVVPGVPSVRVTRAEGQVQVRLQPADLVSRPHPIEKVAPYRLAVYSRDGLSPRLLELLCEEGLKVPQRAQPRVQALLSRLAPMAPVHSDLTATDAALRQVEADATPVVELARWQDGLRVHVWVQPVGPDGPQVRPGEGAGALLTTLGGEPVRCDRDLAKEREAYGALLRACPTLGRAEVRAEQLFLAELVDCLELLEELQALGPDQATVVWREGKPLSLVAGANSSQFRLTMNAAEDWFSAQGDLHVSEDLVITLQALLQALPRRRGRFIALDEQRYVALSAEFSARLELLHSAYDPAAPDDALRLHPLVASVVSGWAGELGTLKLDRATRERLRRVDEAKKLPAQLPSTLDAELRSYQAEGFDWLMRLAHWGAGACLADDMGLGKTIQALALLLHRAQSGPALVVAPTSVCSTWVEQATRFAPSLRVSIWSGAADPDPSEYGPFDVIVCSYTIMALNIERLGEVTFGTVVLDEAQAIKNPSTQRAQAALSLKAGFRLATTGTPIENHLHELWSLMQFLNPGLLGTAKAFERRFVRPIQAEGDAHALNTLRRVVSPFILRRIKRDVLRELPPRTEIVIEVEPSPEERALSEALRRRAVERFKDRDTSSKQDALHILAELTRLRQAACHPGLVDPSLGLESSKLAALSELVRELIDGGHRALVFSQFVSFLEYVRARFDEEQISYQYLDGSTPAAKRTKAVQAFQGGEGDVFLISLKAGGTGLNLTAADYVIHLDPWWNPASEDQASDRAHRIGQTRPVTVYRLVTQGSVEERVIALHAQKRDLATQLLAGRETAKALDADTLLSLLESTSP